MWFVLLHIMEASAGASDLRRHITHCDLALEVRHVSIAVFYSLKGLQTPTQVQGGEVTVS